MNKTKIISNYKEPDRGWGDKGQRWAVVTTPDKDKHKHYYCGSQRIFEFKEEDNEDVAKILQY